MNSTDEQRPTVYIAMSADVIHAGHMNVVEAGRQYGDIVIGLLSDEAIASYKRMPLLSYDEREKIFTNLKGVVKVVRQNTLDYTQNLEELRPNYVVHGDDWRSGIQSEVREKVIETLDQWGGTLIEIPYTSGISCTNLEKKLRMTTSTPDKRRAALRELLKLKKSIRVMEASNGLTGILVEETSIEDAGGQQVKEFDAMWISSLCDSSWKGKPDIELVDLTSRINTINEIMEVTSKPIILDGDTGGKVEHFVFNVRTLERLGVSAIIVEDKRGLKQNSLFGTDVEQTLEDPQEFAHKIRSGKQAQVTRDFMIFARLESLIAGQGVDDALMRAEVYIDAGADGIMIHSKHKDGEEIKEFMNRFNAKYPTVPVIVVPTSYNHMTEDELADLGANIVIYANHLLRTAYPAMQTAAKKILECGRSLEVDEMAMPIKEVLTFIPAGD
ncbi:MAG: phosphoenolpyruvate mutase [Coriobacteriia bacterium]|nr:phosphoenolpyruvate mutase [Coriobacteriia bacterium]